MTSQGESKVRLSGGTKTVELSRVLYMLNVDHKFLSTSCLCDDRHAVLFTNTGCIVEKKNPWLASVNVVVECMLLSNRLTMNLR